MPKQRKAFEKPKTNTVWNSLLPSQLPEVSRDPVIGLLFRVVMYWCLSWERWRHEVKLYSTSTCFLTLSHCSCFSWNPRLLPNLLSAAVSPSSLLLFGAVIL